MPVSSKNEKIKRKYLKWLKEARGLADATIRATEKAIWLYEDFTDHEDYAAFNQKRAVGVKRWLEQRKHQGKPISVTTTYHHLRNLKEFFTWLSGQTGYKSKISIDNISYLSLDKKKVREATASRLVKAPSLEWVKTLAGSIKVETEIDERDRALIAFLFLSGMRDQAIATLPLGCFNRETLVIDQDPAKGVQTKFGKPMTTVLLPFDDGLVEYVVRWAEYLEKTKLFGNTDPLFPRTRVEQMSGGLTFIAREVEPVFWKKTGGIRRIVKERAAVNNLPYYHPHSFRHAAVRLAMKHCRNAEEMKAVSQNFGHENVGTTMMTYGTLDYQRVSEVLSEVDFGESTTEQSNEEIDAAIKLLQGLKRSDR